MKKRILLREILISIVLVGCVGREQSHLLRSSGRSLERATSESRQLGSWWNNLFNHIGHHHKGGSSSGGGSSGGSSGSGGGSSGSSGGSSGSSGNSGGSSSGSSGNSGGNNGGGDGNGDGNGGDGNGDGNGGGGDEAEADAASGDGGNDDGSGGDGGNDDYGNSGGGDDDQSNSNTGDDTSNEDVNGGLVGVVSSRTNYIMKMLMVAFAAMGLLMAAALLLWRLKHGNAKSIPPPQKRGASSDTSDTYKLMWSPAKRNKNKRAKTPPRRKTPPRNRSPTRERMYQGSRKEPLIDTNEYGNDSDSSSSSYSVPQAPGVPALFDEENTVDDENTVDGEESCYSVYTDGPDEGSTSSRTAASTDDESAPMDERADRRKAQIVQPTPAPSPSPMDEAAIDAEIRKNLMAANDIIKKQPHRSHIPFIAGLTELDNV